MVNGTGTTSPLMVYGLPGLKSASGYVLEEWLQELSGDLGRRNLREMIDTSPVVGAARMALEILIRQVSWETIPADDSKAASEVAEYVDGCRNDMETSWEDFIGEHIGYLFWGWELHEIEYKLREGQQDDLPAEIANQSQPYSPYGTTKLPPPSSIFDDGKYGWHRFGVRAQESLLRWEFTPDGRDLLGMWQIPPPTYQLKFVPYAKSMNFRTRTTKGNPEGYSLLRNAFTAHKFSKNAMVQEGIGLERDLAGMPVAKVPVEILQALWGNGTAEDKVTAQAIQKIVTNIRNDEQAGVLWPLDYTDEGKERYILELMSSAGARQFDTGAIISRYEQRILMTFLADFLLIGTQGPGSRALVDPRMNLFSLAGEAYLRQSAATINTRAVRKLCQINRIPLELAPRITPGRVNLTKLLDLANYVLAISQANAASPLAPDVRQELLRRGDLPTADTGATVEDAEPNADATAQAESQAAQAQQQQAGGTAAPREPSQQVAGSVQTSERPAVYPDSWPDWLVHSTDDLMRQRPKDVPPQVYAEIVISSAQAQLARNPGWSRSNARVFEMGETKPR